MSGDEFEQYADVIAYQAGQLGGRCFGLPQLASIRDGFPPRDLAVVNPEAHRVEVLSGQVPLEDRLHSVALDVLIDTCGPQQQVTASMPGAFKSSAAKEPEVEDPTLAALFNRTPGMGPS